MLNAQCSMPIERQDSSSLKSSKKKRRAPFVSVASFYRYVMHTCTYALLVAVVQCWSLSGTYNVKKTDLTAIPTRQKQSRSSVQYSTVQYSIFNSMRRA